MSAPAIDGLTVHKFLAVVELEVAVLPGETAADAERHARTALSEALTGPGDDVTVITITELTR